MNPKRYLITSALPYANGQKHIGHLAGAYIPADVYVRYLRAQKRDVVFVCGSDEHGTAIPIQATKEGTTPQAIIDKYHAVMKQNFIDLSVSFDIYDRTSSPVHHETAQEFFTYLNDRDELEVKETEQYYDEEAKTFLADRYIKGTCPNCGFENAFGDQCERCGTALSPDELINPVSTLSGRTPIKKLTSHWYLPLNKHEDWLRQWILVEHAHDWKTNVLGQCKGWIEAGLQPRAVTRDLDWGVKVPTTSPPGPLSSGAVEGVAGARPMRPPTSVLPPTGEGSANAQSLPVNNSDGHINSSNIENQAPSPRGEGWDEAFPSQATNLYQNTAALNPTSNSFIQSTESSKPGPATPSTALLERGPGGEVGKVLYVWFDAPIGYISATKQWALNTSNDWKPYWLDKETKLVHFIGKDNIVFHCIIFPLMLKLHGYIVPDNVPANEFMNLEGEKMSTSRGWKLDMQDYIDDFINKENGGPQMADALRYYLISILPENKDSDFTWEGFRDAVNGELVAVFANYFNRTLVLMHKLTNGKVPKFYNNLADDKDKALIEEIRLAKGKVERLLEEYKFREGLFEVIELARKGNRYMQEKEPWIKAKKLVDEAGQPTGAQEQIDNCLHLCLQLCANLAVLINPFLPNTAKKMAHLMKVVDKMLDWENAGSVKLLSVGYSLRPPELLFRKIEDTEVLVQVEKLKATLEKSKMEQASAMGNTQSAIGNTQSAISNEQPAANNDSTNRNESITTSSLSNPPLGDGGGEDGGSKPEIQYADFDKLDLRIGTITAAEKVQKADKLLKLEVNMGAEKRTIVSGIAQHFSPESLVGKQVIVVANLAPRKMRGIESQGMILTAEQPDGSLILVNPDAPTQPGSNVK